MIKTIICIECPTGCELTAENGKITGAKCAKGEAYGRQEIENPKRTITATVLTVGLPLKLLPVKTSSPIPKGKIFEAMEQIKKLRIKQPVKAGEVIVKDFLGLADLIATRTIYKS